MAYSHPLLDNLGAYSPNEVTRCCPNPENIFLHENMSFEP